MVQPLSPASAGAVLGVSRSTLRRYADTFADILPDYDASKGSRRKVSYDDMLYLWAIMELHKAQPVGTSREDVLAMIEGPDFDGLVIPEQLPTLGEETQEVATVDPSPVAPGQADLVPAFQDVVSSLRDIAVELQTARLEVTQEVDDLSRKAEETDRKAQAGFNELHARMVAIETTQARDDSEKTTSDRLTVQVFVLSIVVAVVVGSLLTWMILSAIG